MDANLLYSSCILCLQIEVLLCESLAVEQMNRKVKKLHYFRKIVLCFASDMTMADQPVQSYGSTRGLEVIIADEGGDLRHGNQDPAVHLSIVVGRCEGLWELKIKDKLCLRMDSPLRLVKE